MKVAFFSPLSPKKTGVASYVENNILPFLKNYCTIDLIIDDGYKPSNNFIKNNFEIKSISNFDRKDYDILLYNLGNNLFHEYIYKTSLKYPGLVIVHDPFIHGLIWNMTIARKNPQEYIEHVEYCLGERGKKIAENCIATNHYLDFTHPLIKKIADRSLGLIVHSNFAKEVILKEVPQINIKKINHPTPLVSPKNIIEKKDLNISSDTIVISTFGFVSPHKRLKIILKSFQKFLGTYPNSKFLIIGKFLEQNYSDEVREMILDLKIDNKVEIIGYKEDLIPYIQISDIIIQLRYPTAGETSGMTLEIMRQGKPLIVSAVGWFKELPNDVAKKIEVNNDEEENVFKTFLKIIIDKKFAHDLTVNSKKFVKNYHDPEKISFEIYDFLKIFSSKYEEMYLKHISESIYQIGIDNNDSEYIQKLSSLLMEK